MEDENEAKTVSFALSEFIRRFNSLNQEVHQLIGDKGRDINQAIEKLRGYGQLFNEIDPVYQKHKDKLISENPSFQSLLQEFQAEYGDHITALNAQWGTLQRNLSDKIEKGIESLLEVKLNLGLTGAYKSQIEDEIKHSKRSAKFYFFLFILTLLSIPVLIGGIYFIDRFKDLEWNDLFLLKLAIAAPLFWIAKWFSKNYAHARLASVKFDNLNRLLGEGAVTIAKLVEVDSSAKSEVYKRIAELFLDVKDLSSIAVNEPKHPIDDLKELADLLKKIRN